MSPNEEYEKASKEERLKLIEDRWVEMSNEIYRIQGELNSASLRMIGLSYIIRGLRNEK